MAELLYDPIGAIQIAVENREIRAELSEAVGKWEASGIEDYSMTLTRGLPLTGMEAIKVLVRHGEISVVMSARDLNDSVSFAEWPMDEWPLTPIDPEYSYLYDDLTVFGLFRMVEQQLAGGNRLYVTFDQELGYVTSLSYNCNGPYGFARTWRADCGGGWDVRSLVVTLAQP